MKHSLLLCLWRVFFLKIWIFLNIFKKSLEVHTPFQPSATPPGRSLNWILEHRPRANEPMLLPGNQGQKRDWGRHQIISLQNPRIYRMLVARFSQFFFMLFHPKTFPTFPSYPNFAWLKPLWYHHSPWHKSINPWYQPSARLHSSTCAEGGHRTGDWGAVGAWK